MKIQFNEDELRIAVAEHVAKVGIKSNVQTDAISFNMTRNPTGISVEIDLDMAVTVPDSPIPRRATEVTEEAVKVSPVTDTESAKTPKEKSPETVAENDKESAENATGKSKRLFG